MNIALIKTARISVNNLNRNHGGIIREGYNAGETGLKPDEK
jgi:hypothetical protein